MNRVVCIYAVVLLTSAGGVRAGQGREFSKEIPRSSEVLKHLDNEYMAVTIYADATADLLDKKTGTSWRMGAVTFQEYGPIDEGYVWLRTQRMIVEQYPGRFSGRKTGDSIQFTLLGHHLQKMGTFRCDARLDGPWLEFTIRDIDERLQSLVFPTPIESESMVFPRGVGQWVRKPMPDRRFWTFFAHLNMRWFGGLKGDNGWIAIFNKEFADAGVMAAEMSASPGWLKSLGKWSYPRTIRYRFTQGGYVGLAKTYRQWAIENGLFKSLKDKVSDNPLVGAMAGGRILSMMEALPPYANRWFDDRLRIHDSNLIDGRMRVRITHSQAMDIIEEAKALGMTRGLAILRGWIRGGYDESHPDVWPPEQRLGTIEELKQVCSLHGPIVTGLHDNYADIYQQSPTFPKGVFQRANGDLLAGGYWAGGQAYIVNSRNALANLKRNWEQLKSLDCRCWFIDTTTAVQNYESYEPGNRLTRSQDAEYKLELLTFLKQQGVIVGSEEGADYAIPVVNHLENRHTRVAGESIPLWPLVFHDAVFCGRYTGSRAATKYPVWLEDMLWGYMIVFDASGADGWKKQADSFKSTLQVDKWHEQVGLEEMTNHRFLTDDFEVEQAQFGNGLAIIVNFSDRERTADGVKIPPYGYVIRE